MKTNRKEQHTLGTCQVCHQDKAMTQLLPARVVHGSVLELICKDHPDWSQDAYICYSCLNRYRTDYVREQMEKDQGELSADWSRKSLKSMRDNAIIADNLNRGIRQEPFPGRPHFRQGCRIRRQLEIHRHLFRCDGRVDRDQCCAYCCGGRSIPILSSCST